MEAQRRLNLLTMQLTSSRADSDSIASRIHTLISHDNIELRSEMMQFLQDQLFQPQNYISLFEFRDLTLERLKKFMLQRFFSIEDYINDTRRFMAALEVLAYIDYSLCIKMGVHATLCGGTICKLGTSEQRKQYIPAMDNLTLPGCFGMTELAHGSNVLGIETTAVYDPATHDFILHTPTEGASKFWIGGAAQHGKICTVFAQLHVKGKWEGPHVFVVRLRDDQGRVMPGVSIRDCGAKMGLNGVDNGQIWFHNVRIPVQSMLARFASIDDSGTYHSTIADIPKRFGTMMGGLTTGRMLIAQSAIDACKLGLTIAIRYSAQRPQFGDKAILEYVTHQRRLMPSLAVVYAYNFAMKDLKDASFGPEGTTAKTIAVDAKHLHVASSGLKAAATWRRVQILQDCRECCGGMGVLSSNRIGMMLNDMNVDVTFEGDNTVLMQQVAKAILEEVANGNIPAIPPKMCKVGTTSECLDALKELRMEQGRRLAKYMQLGVGNQQDKFDSNLDLAIQLGWVHVAVQTLESFIQNVSRQERVLGQNDQGQAEIKQLLGLVCELYAMWLVQEQQGALAQHCIVDFKILGGVREKINGLCKEMAANCGHAALKLCSAFQLPNHVIQAPIAFDWRAM